MYDSNPLELLKYLLPELSKKNLHFVEIKRHAANEYKKHDTDPNLDAQGRTLPDV